MFKAFLIGGLLSLQSLCALAAEVGEPRQLLARSISSSEALSLSSEDRQWLKHKQHLLLGTTFPDYPPFDINASNNDYEGLTADYAGLLSELLAFASKYAALPAGPRQSQPCVPAELICWAAPMPSRLTIGNWC
ncbi:MAG: hypothetical protein RSC54_02985 [Pseudomonas sp.]|uniref:hypothetical protein n=1 Tax=Pseudomonas sp. TaxID=306 RepID=UPI002FCBD6F9